jgi:putative glycosyltransferase (TIGR04348 family)
MTPQHKKAKPQVSIVTPALAQANNGNWQTARRWARFLAPVARVRVTDHWPDSAESMQSDQVLIALHARRSAASIANWHARHGSKGLVVVLTGTDLYRDIERDGQAQQSVDHAKVLVVLQSRGPQALPAPLRKKARVIFQSSTSRQPLRKSQARLRLLAVGHLRDEKSPQTLFQAVRLLADRHDIVIEHVGSALDLELGRVAQQLSEQLPGYQWLGNLPHEAVRRRIQRAHLLIHPSQMEGGAHVIMEAVTSGTAVLASAVDGNIGMLGDDYQGYFPWGDAQALVDRVIQCRESQPDQINGFLHALQRQCLQRAPLFAPAAEQAALIQLLDSLCGEL